MEGERDWVLKRTHLHQHADAVVHDNPHPRVGFKLVIEDVDVVDVVDHVQAYRPVAIETAIHHVVDPPEPEPKPCPIVPFSFLFYLYLFFGLFRSLDNNSNIPNILRCLCGGALVGRW